jgi:methionyl-tRNA formyltransferase
MKIVFLGTPRFAQIVLEKLAVSKYKPQLVITGRDRKKGRGQALEATPVKIEAQKHHIPISYELSDVDGNFDLAILVAYGHIVPNDILENPKFHFLNVHPSLLPKYRGPSPIQNAILKGENETGVTIIKLDEKLDHGPIISQKSIAIENTDTHATLIEKLGRLGVNLLMEYLPKYVDGSITPAPQVHEFATTTQKITKKDGYISIENLPNKEELDRKIRAFYPWPTVWFEIGGKRFRLLPENKIQPEGKLALSIQEFKNGYPNVAEKLVERIV